MFRPRQRLQHLNGHFNVVIDDLADRVHDCRLLLDQNFGRNVADYINRAPSNCTLLCGSSYALLRPEFSLFRPFSLQRRSEFTLKKLLITMGGIDQENVTAKVMVALRNCPLPVDCEITVVMGQMAPWLEDVKVLANQMPWLTQVHTAVKNMASLMTGSDLAIGAAGSTSWERCCLGLPSVLVVVAENQASIAAALSEAHAAIKVELSDLSTFLPLALTCQLDQSRLKLMSEAARQICDGEGTTRVVSLMMKINNENHVALQ
jgi:UDP-2,4-diacetamido-2,4,6-trideoxy-beta-L-altropyranose hydrolase